LSATGDLSATGILEKFGQVDLFGVSNLNVVGIISALYGAKYWYKHWDIDEVEEEWQKKKIEPPKSKFEEFAQKTLENILETGVVKNKQISHSPAFNPRVKVTPKQARAIVYNLAKKQGFKITQQRKKIVRGITKNLTKN
jgi:hypothetical protein